VYVCEVCPVIYWGKTISMPPSQKTIRYFEERKIVFFLIRKLSKIEFADILINCFAQINGVEKNAIINENIMDIFFNKILFCIGSVQQSIEKEAITLFFLFIFNSGLIQQT
jgi:hypothetical protein